MFFFFNATATTEIYTLSLHDALPIYNERIFNTYWQDEYQPNPEINSEWYNQILTDISITEVMQTIQQLPNNKACGPSRSEEHTSELQSQFHLVCRLLLEKKKTRTIPT